MKTQTLIAAAMFGLTALVANAQITTNIGATSNYVWRHMSYSAEDAAVSGGLDYSHESGFYAGTWTSSMDGQAEIDLYAGYGSAFNDSSSYDIGVIRYDYTGPGDDAYYELYGSVELSGFTIGGAYSFGSDVDDTAGQEIFIDGDIYIYGSYTLDLADKIGEGYSLTGTVGKYFFEDDGVGGVDLDYTHFLVDLAKDLGDYGTVTLSGSFATSEFEGVAAVGGLNGGRDDAMFFVSWGKEF